MSNPTDTNQASEDKLDKKIDEILDNLGERYIMQEHQLTGTSKADELARATQAINNLIEAERLRARVNELESCIEWSSPGAGGIVMSRETVDSRIATLKAELEKLEAEL